MSEIIKRKHPGSIIKKSLDAWNMSSKEFSIRSGISERTLSDIINEKGSITFDIAQKLALYFNNSIEVWLNLQTQYNVYMNHEQLIQAFKEDYQCIKPTLSYLKSINVIADEDIDEQTIVLKTRIALNINRLTTLKQPNSFVSLKELNSNSKDNEVQKNLWISYCLTLARKQTVKEFNKKTLLSYIPEIRSMTKQNPSIFYPRLKEILNESGVCFVLLPYLSKSNIFGATKWLNSSTVMLAISNRGNHLDSFWFTLFHELGHLSMAKLFKVYCHEFSIGFGPTILHRKKEGKETYFSIRAIPLGGFVSMFGEDSAELEEFKNVPVERSLENVKKWKKGIIVCAGVILNAILALVLIGISNIAFPMIGATTSTLVTENSVASSAGFVEDEHIKFIYPNSYEDENGISSFYYEYTDSEKVIHAGSFYIIDPNVVMNEKHYVLAFQFQGNKGNHSFTDGLKLYQGLAKSELATKEHVNNIFKDWALEEGSPEYYPNFEESVYKLDENTKITANISLFSENDVDNVYTKTIEFKTISSGNNYIWEDLKLKINLKPHHI